MNTKKGATRSTAVSPAAPWPAVLLIGPTGSGKTPLGNRMEEIGPGGERHWHFDFGKEMREAASDGAAGQHLTASEIDTVVECLETGALLEHESFAIAQKLLAGFAARLRLGAGDRIVLNGLPRHRGQARPLAPLARVEHVLALECDAETAMARILANSGGDRHGRSDDAIAAVRRRLQIYSRRTSPLLDFYQQAGIPVARLRVEKETTADMLLSQAGFNQKK